MEGPQIPKNEEERLAELRGFDLLDSPAEQDFDEIVRLASLVCETPISLITLLDSDRQWFKAQVGLDVSETSRDNAFCAYAIHLDDLMIVDDATADPRFSKNPLVTGDPNIRFYAGMPLITSSGFKMGSLCVIDNKARTLNDAQKFCLRVLGKQVVKQMEFRRLHSKLKIASDRNSIFVEQSPNALAMLDKEMRYLAASQKWMEDYKLQGKNIIGRSHYDIFPEIGEEWKAIHRAALKGSIHKQEEAYFERADGSAQWISWDVRPWYISNGNVGGLLIYTADLTRVKEKDKENRRIQEILDKTNEIARIGTWEFDVESGQSTWSKVTREIHEAPDDYRPHYATGIHRYKEESQVKIQKAMAEAIERGTPYDLELELITTAGNAIWVRSIGQAEFEKGVCKRLYGVFQDIHQIKNAEESLNKVNQELRAIFNAGPISIISTDKIGRIIHFNRGAESMLQYSPAELSGIETPLILHTKGELKKMEDELSSLHHREIKGFAVFEELTREANYDSREWTYVRKDGTSFPVQLIITAMRNKKQEVTGYLGVAMDITESKKAKEAILEAKNMAEQSAKLKETFLANMSHEIRTPMNSIMGFTDLLLKRDLGPEEREYLQIVRNSGENLLRIINDILDISKINSGMMDFEEHPINIKDLFHSLKSMLQQTANEKHLGLFFDTDLRLPEIMLGDPTRLTQILLNLAGNALKFTREGSVRVFAKVLKEELNSWLLEFSVTDTGIGIAEDKLQQIFERFTQAETHTARKYGGTGLGLSIAKQLVELQGGSIHIKSSPGLGSTFTFTLPLKKTEQGPAMEPGKAQTAFAALNGLSILVVDDNPINIKLILGLLSDFNITYETAEDGRQAWQKIKANSYDLVLLDIEMPEMNGYEVTTLTRKELNNPVPIIAMTAHALAGEKEKCLRLGMTDYIAKPIKAELLIEKMILALSKTKGKSTPPGKTINLNYLLESMAGKKDLVVEVLNLFLELAPEDLEYIREAISRSDYSGIRKRSHRLRSTVLTIGADRMGSLLKEMEQLAVGATGLPKIKALNEELNALYKLAHGEVTQAKHILVNKHA